MTSSWQTRQVASSVFVVLRLLLELLLPLICYLLTVLTSMSVSITCCLLKSLGTISPGLIQGGTTNKLVEEFNFLRAQAMEPLGKFLDFITCVTWLLGSCWDNFSVVM